MESGHFVQIEYPTILESSTINFKASYCLQASYLFQVVLIVSEEYQSRSLEQIGGLGDREGIRHTPRGHSTTPIEGFRLESSC